MENHRSTQSQKREKKKKKTFLKFILGNLGNSVLKIMHKQGLFLTLLLLAVVLVTYLRDALEFMNHIAYIISLQTIAVL